MIKVYLAILFALVTIVWMETLTNGNIDESSVKNQKRKRFFGRKHAHPTVSITLQPGLQKAFQMDTASVVARWQSKWGRSKCRSSGRITIFIYLHIFINLTVFKLYSGRIRDPYFTSEYRSSLYYISSTKHASTPPH